MIAFISRLTAWDYAAILTGWILIAVAMGPLIGRALKHADPGEDREQYEPPTSVPQPDSTWMDLVSVDCLRDTDPLLHERFAHIIAAEWEWSE